MPEVALINRFLQRELHVRGLKEVTAVEAAHWLDQAGMLRNSPTRSGILLRDLRRARKIRGQRQELNGRWFIEWERKGRAGSVSSGVAEQTPPKRSEYEELQRSYRCVAGPIRM